MKEEHQRALHEFLVGRLETLEPFTKGDIRRIVHLPSSALDTYWSNQFKGLFERVGGERYRLTERFRRYGDWRRFRELLTGTEAPPPAYKPSTFRQVVIFEFYLPLTHETALRRTLDSLFFLDSIEPRLRRCINALRDKFDSSEGKDDALLVKRVCDFVSATFGGYSVYHVDGRFRSAELMTQEEACQHRSSKAYLVDETTAVARFIFPCAEGEEDRVRFLFDELFVKAIAEQVSGEDEVWMVESGLRNCVHVWKPRR